MEERTDGGNGGDNLTKLQLVEDGGFTGGIETDHENSHLLLPPQLVKQLGKGETHDGDFLAVWPTTTLSAGKVDVGVVGGGCLVGWTKRTRERKRGVLVATG